MSDHKRRLICASASAARAAGVIASVASARNASAKAASTVSEMFRMLVFLIASPQILAVSWLGVVCLNSGHMEEGLPLLGICLMCCSYFVKGAAETFEYIRSRIK